MGHDSWKIFSIGHGTFHAIKLSNQMYILSSCITLKMMVILIEITVENRLKWIIILLLYLEMICFYVSIVCAFSQYSSSPFLLSQWFWCMPPISVQCSGCAHDDMPPVSLHWSRCMPSSSLSLWFWNSPDCLLPLPFPFAPILKSHAIFYCYFIHINFLNILTMRRSYPWAMFSLNPNSAVSFYHDSNTINQFTFRII